MKVVISKNATPFVIGNLLKETVHIRQWQRLSRCVIRKEVENVKFQSVICLLGLVSKCVKSAPMWVCSLVPIFL